MFLKVRQEEMAQIIKFFLANCSHKFDSKVPYTNVDKVSHTCSLSPRRLKLKDT